MEISPSEWGWMMQCCTCYPDPIILAQSLSDAPARLSQNDDPVERLLVRSQAAALLTRAIERLNVRERVVLHLTYVEKMSLNEVAEAMNYGLARIYLIKKQSLSRLHHQMSAIS